MTPLMRALPVMMLLATSATATAQSAPSTVSSSVDQPSAEVAPAPLPPNAPLLAPTALPAAAFAERSDVVAVRRKIMALRLACAAMPPHISIESVPLVADRVAPPNITIRPYASEENTCTAVLNPEQAGPGYAIQLGMMGAGLTLLALMFFTLIGGVLRVLWNGPIARFLPSHFARRLYG